MVLFPISIIIFLGFLFLIVWIILNGVYLIQQAEAVVVERFGRFDRVLGPGLYLVIPFMERPRSVIWSYFISGPDKRAYRQTKTLYKIDLRENVFDFPKQNVITKDNVTMEISAVLYFQITDPKSAIYEVSNLPEAIEKLTQTTLRNIIGSMDLDETLVSRDKVNEKLRYILDDASDKWGVKVNRVELQEVNPPADIRNAMEKQMRAERDKRAAILESEGQKQSTILRAEADRESSVLIAKGYAESKLIEAEGDAEARLRLVKAESMAIEMVKQSCPNGDPLSYLATLNYIKAFAKINEGANNKLIILPYESSGTLGSIAAIKRILDESGSTSN